MFNLNVNVIKALGNYDVSVKGTSDIVTVQTVETEYIIYALFLPYKMYTTQFYQFIL